MTRIEHNDDSYASARTMVTPELVDYYVREGQRLRAQTLQRLGRQIGAAIAARLRTGRRMGTLTPTAAHAGP